MSPSGIRPSRVRTALRHSSRIPKTLLTLISCSRQVDTNTKNVFGQPRLRASLRDLRSPRKNYKSTIEDDLKKLIIMDNLAPDQERDAGVRSGLQGGVRAENLPPTATPASSCRSLAFDPCRPCLGVRGFVAGIRDITSSVRPKARCKPAWWAGRDLFHTRGPHVTGKFSEASWSPSSGTKSGGRVPWSLYTPYCPRLPLTGLALRHALSCGDGEGCIPQH